jgi:hypothetical protein
MSVEESIIAYALRLKPRFFFADMFIRSRLQ